MYALHFRRKLKNTALTCLTKSFWTQPAFKSKGRSLLLKSENPFASTFRHPLEGPCTRTGWYCGETGHGQESWSRGWDPRKPGPSSCSSLRKPWAMVPHSSPSTQTGWSRRFLSSPLPSDIGTGTYTSSIFSCYTVETATLVLILYMYSPGLAKGRIMWPRLGWVFIF